MIVEVRILVDDANDNVYDEITLLVADTPLTVEVSTLPVTD